MTFDVRQTMVTLDDDWMRPIQLNLPGSKRACGWPSLACSGMPADTTPSTVPSLGARL